LSDWAKYVATDSDGSVWEYRLKPEYDTDGWIENVRENGESCGCIAHVEPPEDASKTLVKLSRNG
jgi:hypothetical protein